MTTTAASARPRLLTSAEVGEWIGVTPAALSAMRFKGRGPRYRKLGSRTIRYDENDVQDWIDQSARTGTFEAAS
jgi:predicted DNA-binding transcriptional regulator AlpA